MSEKHPHTRSEWDQYYYNKGEQDAENRKYEKPHTYDPTGGMFTADSDIKDNEAYKAGYRNTTKQKGN
jgi:hypothetical protein